MTPRPETASRALRALIALLLGALALAGCARIPVEGAVQDQARQEAADDPGNLYYPQPPEPGAPAESIVRGFLDAGTGAAENYKVAREFLTQSFSAAWDATASTVVVDADPTVAPMSGSTVRVSMKAIAHVDADGRYEEYAAPRQIDVDLELEQVGGEWRISTAPGGIVLLKQNFANIFKAFPVSFLDDADKFLVPELRWFPQHASAPTRIVQALLRGPSPWLAEGGVHTAFPAGTQLLGPITPQNGEANANFSSGLSEAAGPDYPLMKRQLDESLAAFDTITSVAMLVNGAKLEVTAPSDDTLASRSQVGSLPLVVRDGVLGYLSGEQIVPLGGAEALEAALPELRATAGAVSNRISVGAFKVPTGVVAVSFAGGEAVPIDARADVLPPAIGPSGFVWTATPSSPALRIADPVYGTSSDIDLPAMGQSAVRAIALSRSGTVISLAIERQGHAAIASMSVIRDATTGRPSGLGTPQILEVDAPRAIDLAWVDATTLALLAGDETTNTEVFVQQLGGTVVRYGGVEGGRSIDGSNTKQGLRVCDADGNIYVPRATQWQASGARVDFLVSQG